LCVNAFPQDFAQELAVINTRGDVWARDLDLSGGNVGAGVKLTGPSLFGWPDDQFVDAQNFLHAISTVDGSERPPRKEAKIQSQTERRSVL
jgi:hypothetical protein